MISSKQVFYLDEKPNINETFVELFKSNVAENFNNESLKVLEIPCDTLNTDIQCAESKVYLVYSDDYDFTLADYIKENGCVHLEQALEWMIDLMKELSKMHANKIIHRNVNPQDLLIKNGILKLGGFDLTCKSVVNQTNFKWKAGKSPYLSPNVLKGNYDFNSDVWSSGCVLFEMIKGERLFDNLKETKKTLRKRIENKEINRVFEKMMKRNQKKRITSAQCLDELMKLKLQLEEA